MNWLILAFISAILSATATIFEKKSLFELDALLFSLLLAFFNMIFSLPFFLGFDFATVTAGGISILYIKTIISALAFWCVMLSIKNLELSGALPLMVLTPGLVAIAGFFFLGDVLSGYEIFGIILLLAGTYVLDMQYKKDLLSPFKILFQSKQHNYIVYALLLFTVSSLLDKLLLTDMKMPPNTFMAFQQIFLFINFSILYFLILRKPAKAIYEIRKGLFGVIILVAVLTIIYRYTQAEAVQVAPVALVLSVKRTSVFFAAVIGGKIFREHYLLRKSLATIILIAGALLIIYS